MRVMVFVKATGDSEAGLPPTEDMTAMFAAMGAYNEQLVDAGILVDGDGLKTSSGGCLGQTLPEPDAGAERTGNPAFLRTGGFWRSDDTGTGRTGETAARKTGGKGQLTDHQEEKEDELY